MPIIYKRNCNYCGKFYKGYGDKFCSHHCSGKHHTFILGLGFQKGNKFSLKEFTKEHKKKISEAHMGMKKPWAIPPHYEGEKNSNWKGGKIKNHGYWFIYNPSHPTKATLNNHYVRQSVIIAEKILGRFLKKEELIHHINGIKDDDRPENLYLFPSQKFHLSGFHLLKNKPILQSNLL